MQKGNLSFHFDGNCDTQASKENKRALKVLSKNFKMELFLFIAKTA
jgi:hypothetical protein